VRHGRCAGGCATQPSDGAGILNGGTLSLDGVEISGNRVEGGRGGALKNFSGTIPSIRDSTFSGNLSDDEGGAIDNGGTIGEIVRSLFADNHVISAASCTEGGAIYAGVLDLIAFTTFDGNTTSSGGCGSYGGAIYADDDLGLITDSTFTNNSSGKQGGAIYTDGSNAIGAITRTLFAGNSSEFGGGLREYDGSMGTISNSTFSGNTATGAGGAIETRSGTIAGLVNVTIVGNSAPMGAGIYSESGVPISNSILAGNTGGDTCEGTVTDSGGNRDDDDTCAPDDIAPETDYETSLAANGGATLTHALTPASVAIDDLGACPESIGGVDQRGAPRTDGACDIGAFEAVEGFLFADGFASGTDGAWSERVP